MPTVRLNGWQRLWVVLGVVGIVLAVVVMRDFQPTREEIYQQWASDQWEELRKDHRFSGLDYWQFKSGMEDSTEFGVVARLNFNARKSRIDSLKSMPAPDTSLIRVLEYITTIRPIYEKRLARFPQARALFWIKVVGRWAGVMAVLYLGGWAIGWIFHGFFPPPASGH